MTAGPRAKPGEGPLLSCYLVQRRLPGIQGENGCWADEGLIVTTSAEAAVFDVVSKASDNLLHGEWRAAVQPEWESFWPRSETICTRTVSV